MNTLALPVDDIDFIEDEIRATQKAHTRTLSNGTETKVRSTVQIARDEYRETKRQHRNDIKKLKLLIKQSHTSYRLIKLNEK